MARPGRRNALRHKPHGVLAVLGPYNFPAHLPNGHIVPALIAGNAIVFKPSEKTPAVGEMLVDYYRKAGIPEGVIRIAQGGPETGKALSQHPDIDGLLFTGSAQTGIALNRQFAQRPDKILALEMGGNNPIIVWDTRDIHSAAVLVVQSAFLSAGQRCTAARRLIVKDELYDLVVGEVKKIADRLVIGEPHGEPPPFMGPVIDNDVCDNLVESFLALMSRGGRPIKHMQVPVQGRPFLTPGIIDVTDMVERPDIELFGPLLQVIRVPDFNAAIARGEQHAFRPFGIADRRHSRSNMTNSGPTAAPASSTGTRQPTARHRRRRLAALAFRATTGQALIMPPIIAPIRLFRRKMRCRRR